MSDKTARFSTLETYSRAAGYLEAMMMIEIYWRVGAIPDVTYFEILGAVIHDPYMDLDRVLKVFFPTVQLPLLPEIKEAAGQTFFAAFKYMIDSHEEFFNKLAPDFVSDFLEKYTIEGPKAQIQTILYTLQRRLIARQEAVERFQYDRLKTIDDNIRHLLDTLKEYGIDAKTYDEARKQYERKFPQKAAKDFMDEVRERISRAMHNKSRLREDCEQLCKLHPESADSIRWEYQQEIDKLDL